MDVPDETQQAHGYWRLVSFGLGHLAQFFIDPLAIQWPPLDPVASYQPLGWLVIINPLASYQPLLRTTVIAENSTREILGDNSTREILADNSTRELLVDICRREVEN